jgi:tripartite-type tricarboxylate transporter receptor subunit TctC
MAVKQAPPDGHTLLEFVVGTHALNQTPGGDTGYDVQRDFAPVTQLWNFTLLLAVPSSLPVNSVSDLIAYGKTKPGGLSYASTAINSASHLLGSMLSHVSGVPMVHVPYRGAAPALTDLIAGRVDFYFVSYAAISSFVADGRAKLLGVGGPVRLKATPDVPTMAEAGYPTVKFGASFGLTAPAKTPPEAIDKINAAFVTAAHDPEFLKVMDSQGVEIVTNSPAEFKAIIAAEVAQLDQIIKAAGVAAPQKH